MVAPAPAPSRVFGAHMYQVFGTHQVPHEVGYIISLLNANRDGAIDLWELCSYFLHKHHDFSRPSAVAESNWWVMANMSQVFGAHQVPHEANQAREPAPSFLPSCLWVGWLAGRPLARLRHVSDCLRSSSAPTL